MIPLGYIQYFIHNTWNIGSDYSRRVKLLLMEQSLSTNARSIWLIISQAGINAELIRQSRGICVQYYIVYVDM